jgi:hypothetical protein
MFMGYVSLAQWRAGAAKKSRSMGIGGAVSSRRREDAGRWAIFAAIAFMKATRRAAWNNSERRRFNDTELPSPLFDCARPTWPGAFS